VNIKRPGTEFSIQETGNIPLSSPQGGSAEPRQKRFYWACQNACRCNVCWTLTSVTTDRWLKKWVCCQYMFNLFILSLHYVSYWMLISNLQYEPSSSSSSSRSSPLEGGIVSATLMSVVVVSSVDRCGRLLVVSSASWRVDFTTASHTQHADRPTVLATTNLTYLTLALTPHHWQTLH